MQPEARKTIKLALPIILGELAQMALHLIDTAMIGAINYKQVAAAGLVFSFITIPFVFGIGITMSVSQLVSMAHGKNDKQLVSHYFYNGFWLCLSAALLISAGLELGKGVLFDLGQDPEVARLAVPFLQVMGLSVIPMLVFMTLKQFTDGLQFTRTAMVLSLISLPLNIFLNWLLIYGNWGFPRLELMGAGYATLITRSLICIILGFVVLYHPNFRKYIAVRHNQWKFKLHTFKELARIGVPSALQIGMEAGVFALSGIIVGTISSVQQAAHQIALSCASFTFMVSMGLAQAGSIRVSNSFGAGNWKKIHAIGKTTLITALAYGIICALFFIGFRHQLPLLFNDDAEVLQMGATLLFLAAIFQISDATQAISSGLLRGAKDVNVPTVLIAVAYWALGLPIGYFLGKIRNMGAPGIWLGFIIGLTFASITLSLRFFRKTKQHI